MRFLSAYAREGLRREKVKIIESTTPIIPLYTYTVENTLTAARKLYDAGVYVNPVLPPATPPAECLLRTSYMATLTEPLIDEAVGIIGSVLGEKCYEQGSNHLRGQQRHRALHGRRPAGKGLQGLRIEPPGQRGPRHHPFEVRYHR